MLTRLFAASCLLVAAAARLPAQLAPGVVSVPDSGESFGTLTPDGKELIYTIHRADFSRHRIVSTRWAGGSWSAPATLPFSGTYNDREPKLSPDGGRLYFSSNRPIERGDTARRRDLDLWFVDRDAAGGWGAPRHIDAPVNTSKAIAPAIPTSTASRSARSSATMSGAPRSTTSRDFTRETP